MRNAIFHPIRAFREWRKERAKRRLRNAMCAMMDAVTAAQIEAIRISPGSSASKFLATAEALWSGLAAKQKIKNEDPALWADRARAGVDLFALRMAKNEAEEKIKEERAKAAIVGGPIGEGGGCVERLSARVADSIIIDGANK